MKAYLYYVLLPGIVVVLAISLSVPDPAPEDSLEYAELALASGNRWVAYDTLDRVLGERPYDLEVHRRHVQAHHRISRSDRPESYEKSRFYAHYKKLTTGSDPRLADIGFYALGLGYALRGHYQKALTMYDKVADRSMKYLNNSTGYCHMELGAIRRAEEHFRRELELPGFLDGAVNNYANLLLREQRLVDAEHLITDSRYRPYVSLGVRKDVYFLTRRWAMYYATLFSSYGERFTPDGLVGALAITVIWLFFVRTLDLFEPEQLRFLVATLLVSCVITELLTFFLYDFAEHELGFRLEASLWREAVYCVFGIGLIEESVKLLPVLVVFLFTNQINESTDWVVYASTAALGFALQENLGYFHAANLNAIAGRGIMCTGLHMALSSVAISGVLLHRYCGKPRVWIPTMFLIACTLHGLYDLPLVSKHAEFLAGLSMPIFLACLAGYRRVFLLALAHSEFFQQRDLRYLTRRAGRILTYGLSYVLVLQYVVLALRFGPHLATLSTGSKIIGMAVVLWLIRSMIGQITPPEVPSEPAPLTLPDG